VLGYVLYSELFRPTPLRGLVPYKLHRTLHENLTLYESAHRTHHISIYPTLLDNGTQGILEIFGLLSVNPFMPLLPDVLYFVIFALVTIVESTTHHTPKTEAALGDHQLHHRYQRVNYGIGGVYWDRRFGTLNGPKQSAHSRPAPVTAPT
jgi:sterol desaturase/sphingolipid hydroxylase (fatty acid hydroxylase superfamily)